MTKKNNLGTTLKVMGLSSLGIPVGAGGIFIIYKFQNFWGITLGILLLLLAYVLSANFLITISSVLGFKSLAKFIRTTVMGLIPFFILVLRFFSSGIGLTVLCCMWIGYHVLNLGNATSLVTWGHLLGAGIASVSAIASVTLMFYTLQNGNIIQRR